VVIEQERPSALPGDLTPDLLARAIWTDAMVADAGIPIVDVPFVTVGGGLGSFTLVDHLRVAGVAAANIKALSVLEKPFQTYQLLVRSSQIPDHERLRSDSGSVMDNIWGFPSYAVREAFAARNLQEFVRPLWNVLVEPVFANFFTPRAGQVYTSVERECQRIGWGDMLVRGQVRMVRKRDDSGYFTILTPQEGTAPTRRVAYRSRFVHLAVGYPGARFLPDLQTYLLKHNDFARVVNAYAPHEHVYEQLIHRKGVVVVRGSGIVASRVLQRLIDDRERHGAQTTIWHVIRNYVAGPEGPPWHRRRGADGWAFQGFNYTKSSWGGQHRKHILKLNADDRVKFIESIGGTSTAIRDDWQRQLREGRRDGFYRVHTGEVEKIERSNDGAIVTYVQSQGGAMLEIPADFIIDATGLENDVREHRLLADLIDYSGAQLNPARRLNTTPSFEVEGTSSGNGRLYASGTMTYGSYYAPADSFLGLQYAALQITDDLARNGFGRHIDMLRSISQWLKWMMNQPP
jgi:hypothetical protein